MSDKQLAITGFGMCGGHQDSAKDYEDKILFVRYKSDGIKEVIAKPVYAVYRSHVNRSPIGWLKNLPEKQGHKLLNNFNISTNKAIGQPHGYMGLGVHELPPSVWIPTTTPHTTKEKSTMKTPELKKALNTNVSAAKSAAVMESGRIANIQLAKIVARKTNIPNGELLETPLGHLVVANAASLAAQAFYESNPSVQRLTQGMVVAAYQEMLQTLDLNGIIDELLANPTIATALADEKKEASEADSQA